MKFAIYTLAGAMIVVTIAGLALSGGQPVAAPRQPRGHEVVYVDLDRLVQSHPAWQAVLMTRSVVNDARPDSIQVGGSSQESEAAGSKIKYPNADPNIRERLVSEAIRVADEAMIKLETQQLETVDIRLRQRRETMEKSAESEVTAGVREINEKAESDVEQIARRYCPDKINAELKFAALKLKSGKPGIDDKANSLKIEEAGKNLARINEQCSTETSRVLDQAKAQIEALWSNATTRTDAYLSIIESGEKRKISNRAAASRNEILREMLSLYDSGSSLTALQPAMDTNTSASLSRVASVGSSRMDIGDWRNENIRLESRIRQGVKAVVSRIARDQGVRVVFSRTSKGVPDETGRFARLMSERAWDGCDPVVSMAGES
ncbi:MAG: hypothetical protein ABFD83_03820 [Armatimonadota bacterium]